MTRACVCGVGVLFGALATFGAVRLNGDLHVDELRAKRLVLEDARGRIAVRIEGSKPGSVSLDFGGDVEPVVLELSQRGLELYRNGGVKIGMDLSVSGASILVGGEQKGWAISAGEDGVSLEGVSRAGRVVTLVGDNSGGSLLVGDKGGRVRVHGTDSLAAVTVRRAEQDIPYEARIEVRDKMGFVGVASPSFRSVISAEDNGASLKVYEGRDVVGEVSAKSGESKVAMRRDNGVAFMQASASGGFLVTQSPAGESVMASRQNDVLRAMAREKSIRIEEVLTPGLYVETLKDDESGVGRELRLEQGREPQESKLGGK